MVYHASLPNMLFYQNNQTQLHFPLLSSLAGVGIICTQHAHSNEIPVLHKLVVFRALSETCILKPSGPVL